MSSTLVRVVFLGLSVVLANSSASAQPSLASVLAKSPFSASDLEQLLEGQTVVQALAEAGTKELAAGAACLIREGSTSAALAPFVSDRPVLPDEHLLESAVLSGEPAPELFRGIKLEPSAAAEVARYLEARPGFALNLSQEEIAEFSALEISGRAAENISKVHARLRKLLAARYGSYRKSGLDGIAEYARSTGSSASPAQELRASTRASGLDVLAPSFERAWLDYPRGASDRAVSTYFWARVEVDDRPAVALVHRLSLEDGASHVVGQRTFYLSHYFDSGESLVAVAPVAEGILFLYQDRIWLDEASGLSGRIKKALGRRFLQSHVKETIEKLGVCPG